MPRQVAVAVENNFKQGLITEATGLNFPENACVETYNCEFDLLGRVYRRPGIDFETNFSTNTVDRTGAVISSYVWKNVTGDGTVSFIVAQVGSRLYFYNAQSTTTLSQGLSANSVDLTAFSPSSAPSPSLNECQYSDGIGKLFIVHPNLEAFYIVYNASLGTFSTTQINILIRDFDGLNDTLAVDTRPTTTLGSMSKEHAYNLYNQGWNTDNVTLTAWDTARTDMPSNADVWWTFKDSSDAFAASTVPNIDRGNTPAPKGHYVLNLYNQDRSTASGVASIPIVSTGSQRASTTCFFAGRSWYAGINSIGQNSKIYFSQIILNDKQIGLCYQNEDPTAETLSDLNPDDGGVISIPEAGTIYRLFPMQSALIVFAFRGVFVITGSSGVGFSADDYTITKISNYRTVSASSFVEVNNVPIWWTQEGIWTIQGQNGGYTVQSLSFTSIQTFFTNIPNSSKLYARGYFNPTAQEVKWLYRSVDSQALQNNYEFDSVLTLNILTGSFAPSFFDTTNVSIHGVVVTDSVGGTVTELPIIDAASENVVDGSGNQVVVYSTANTITSPTFKFLVSYTDSGSYKFTYADLADLTYTDFVSFDSVGIDFTSYFITGYKTHGDAERKFQPTYVYVFHEGLGQFKIQGVWNYSLSGNTGKFSTSQKLVYDDALYSNNHKRIKMRGSGLTLQYYIQSVSGQPFNLIGWSTFETANAAP